MQYLLRAAAPPVLGCRLGVGGYPAEQRAQGHVLAEGHQPDFPVGAHRPVRSDQDRRLGDSPGRSGCVDVDQQVRTDPPGQLRQVLRGVGVAGEIDSHAALSPDEQVRLLARQGGGEGGAGRLTARGVVDPGAGDFRP